MTAVKIGLVQTTNNVGSNTLPGISPPLTPHYKPDSQATVPLFDSCQGRYFMYGVGKVGTIYVPIHEVPTAVKLEHPLTIITCLYLRLIFLPIQDTYFFKVFGLYFI